MATDIRPIPPTTEGVGSLGKTLVEHARYLRAFNRHGNWLTMEMNGLYHVGALFPELREAAEWRDYAAGRLRAELDEQVYPDGAQVELTPGYHNVALDNFMGIVRMAQLKTGYTYFPYRNDFLWVATDGASGAPPDAYGRPFVVDVGSYAYDASAWRKYVLSSHAHNVVLVDGRQQNRRADRSTYVTDSPCPVVWHSSPAFGYAQATYGDTGERYGPERSLPAIQTRRILFVKEEKAKYFWVVADTLVPQDDLEHTYEALFHLSPSAVTAVPGTGAVETKHAGGPNLGIYPLQVPGLSANVVEGQEEPYIQGWLPRGHGISGMKPAPTVTFTLTGRGEQHMLYVFYPVPAGVVPPVTVSRWDEASSWKSGAPAIQLTFADSREYRVALPSGDVGGLIVEQDRRVIS